MNTRWISKIPQTVKRTDAELSQLVKRTAFQVEAGAKLRAPVDTGFLRNSIQTTFEGDLSAIVFVGADYAVHVEFGTRRQRAQPFLIPAFEEAARGIGAEIQKVL